MGYVYKSEIHVFNIINKSLKEKELYLSDDQRSRLKSLIKKSWDMQNDFYKLGVLVEYNTHLPLNSLTWWAYGGSFTKTENYLRFLEKFIGQFDVLFRMHENNSIDYDDPEIEMILRKNEFDIDSFIKNKIEGSVTQYFRNKMNDLQNRFGIYFLYDKEKKLIYVGKSINLGERIISSIDERGACFFEYALTETLSDASVYEMYYISLLKPKLNVEGNHFDQLTINLPCIRDNKLHSIFKQGEENEQFVNK